ncbi:MAG: DUF2304 family protein [Terriglobia bacterium]
MSMLRWFGLAVGAVSAITLFRMFRQARIRRLDFSLGILISLGLVIASLVPNSVNLLRSMLSLQDEQFSRLIAISIISNVLLWVLLFYTRYQRSRHEDKFDRFVRRVASEEFSRLYSESRTLAPVLVVIPAYNEAESLGPVVQSIPSMVCGRAVQTLVIDDGSDDQTFEVSRQSGALAVHNPMNRGGGAALRIGFDIARAHGVEIVVTLDADGQHLPEEMERLVQPILNDQFDIVIGSRILGEREKDSGVRYAGLHLFNFLIHLLSPVSITDCSSGYRALRVNVLTRVRLRQDQFHTSELIIDAARKGIRIGEAPVTIKRRLSGTSKKGRNLTYGLNFAKTVLKSWWR